MSRDIQQLHDAIRSLISSMGDDPDREGLIDTPRRVLSSYTEMFSGYADHPLNHMTTFEENSDEIVLVKNIDFVSFCEHHLLPFTGVAHIAYLPDGRVMGLSKIARVLDVYAKRLQLQERITTQVTEALQDHLQPLGSACIIRAKHTCLGCRGAKKPNAEMITSSMRGVFENNPARTELLSLIGDV